MGFVRVPMGAIGSRPGGVPRWLMDEESMDWLGEYLLTHYLWGHPLTWVLVGRLREREEQDAN